MVEHKGPDSKNNQTKAQKGEIVAVGAKFNSGINKRSFPKFQDSTSKDRPIKGGAGSPWVANVTEDDVLYMYRRDELANKALNKLADAVFNKWLRVKSDDPALAEAIEKSFTDLNAQEISKDGYKKMKVLGLTLIALGFEESVATMQDPTQMPENVKGLSYIHAIRKTVIDEIIQDLNPMSQNYGRITAYKINIPVGASHKSVQFPAVRFLHWANKFVDDDPEGISMFEPVYDKFVVKKNLDFAIGEVPYQMAVPLKELTTPKDADDAELDAAETSFQGLNARSYMMTPEGYEMKIHATNVALNPKEYVEYVVGTLAANLTGSKIALMGTEAGSLSGSEVNQQDWFATVSAEQRTVVEPLLRALVEVQQFFGIIDEGEFWFEWEPQFELDEKELSEIRLNNARALQATALAMGVLEIQGFQITQEDGQTVFTKDGKQFIIPSSNALVQPRGPDPSSSTLAGGLNIRAPFLSEEERIKLFEEWEIKAIDVENKMSDNFQSHETIMGTEFMDAFRESWEDNIGDIGVDPSAEVAAKKNDEADLIDEMDDFVPKDLNKFKKDTVENLEAAYITGAKQTLEKMGFSPTSFRLTDTGAIRVLRAQGSRLANGTWLSMREGAMRVIEDGIRAGESYAQINNRIASSFKEFAKGIPNTVHKFVHETTSQARWDTLEARGQDQAVFLTAGDTNVRDEHAALDGQTMTRAESMPVLAEFGCRCTMVPITAWDRAVLNERETVEEGIQKLITFNKELI